MGYTADRMLSLPAAILAMVAGATAHAAEERADAAALRAQHAPSGAMWVEEIGLERLSQRRGTPRAGRTIRDKPILLGGRPLCRDTARCC